MSSAPAFLPTSFFDIVPRSHSVAAPGVGVVFLANLIKRDYKVLVLARMEKPWRTGVSGSTDQWGQAWPPLLSKTGSWGWQICRRWGEGPCWRGWVVGLSRWPWLGAQDSLVPVGARRCPAFYQKIIVSFQHLRILAAVSSSSGAGTAASNSSEGRRRFLAIKFSMLGRKSLEYQ